MTRVLDTCATPCGALLAAGLSDASWPAFWSRFVAIAGDLADEDGPSVAQLTFRAFERGSIERALWKHWQWGQA